MKIAVLSYTGNGSRLSAEIAGALCGRHEAVRYLFKNRTVDFSGEIAAQTKMSPAGTAAGVRTEFFCGTDDLMKAQFRKYDAWIFVCACGIAVRAIAPYLESKKTDPAVVVMDEGGRFAMPILSGHVGGANALSERLAEITGAQAVITTATDIGGRFSPDSFAAANDLIIGDFEAAKEIASAVLRGEKIAVMSEWPLVNLPEECIRIPVSGEMENCFYGLHNTTDGSAEKSLHNAKEFRYGICISRDSERRPFAVTLPLTPRNLVLGIGCKRGTPAGRISLQVYEAFRTRFAGDLPEDFAGRAETARRVESMLKRICAVSSIDRKAQEDGLIEFCEQRGLMLVTFSAEELQETVPAQGDGPAFSSSDFVRETVGVDNVCERSAVRCSKGRLILSKYAGGGVTVAAAEKPVVIDGACRIAW